MAEFQEVMTNIEKLQQVYYYEGYKECIKECLDIVKFYSNEYDGIYWAEREIEELL